MAFDANRIQEARERIAPYVEKTPLLRLSALDERLGCQVYGKLECMQKTGAFKLRGAMNAALSLTPEELKNGIVAASSGNHGRAIAYTAKLLGTSAVIVMPKGAPQIKIDAIRALGAEVVLCETSERFRISEEICREKNASLIPPYNDERVMAGQGTIGLEIMEQCPETDMIVVPVSGGGLLGGIATAVKSQREDIRILGAEPAALPRYQKSLEKGEIVSVPQKGTIADALLSQAPGTKCFPQVLKYVEQVAPVSEEYLLKGQKLLLTEGKIFAEVSACIGIGAVLEGRIPVKKEDKVCFVISGGSASLEQLQVLKEIELS